MFSGIVEGTRPVVAISDQPDGKKIIVDLKDLAGNVAPGDSVSVSGVCLTVEEITDNQARFHIMAETLRKTTLNQLTPGDLVNIERSLRVGDRIHGHFVQGHVFSTGKVTNKIADTMQHKITIDAGALAIYLAPVGSIAVDGVSLTLASLKDAQFSIALIPATLQQTTLGQLEPGDKVNLEPDIISRQVVAYLNSAKLP